MAFDLDFVLTRQDVREKGLDIEIVPSPEQIQELCHQFEILTIPVFSTQVHIRPWHGADGVALEGQIFAELVQACVVTGEEVHSSISEPFTVHLLSEEKIRKMERRQEAQEKEIVIDVDADDPPDVLENEIPVGEYVAEYFSLYVDPYPRGAGAGLDSVYQRDDEPEIAEDEGEDRENPFAALAQLKKND